MKIQITSFGPIKRFDYDFDKSLIVTYGDNNIGKSYSMQLVYLLFKYLFGILDGPAFFPSFYGGRYFFDSRTEIQYDKIEKFIISFSKKDEDEEDISSLVSEEVKSLVEKVFLHNFINGCKNTFGNYESLCEKKPLLRIELRDVELVVDFAKDKLECNFSLPKIELKKVPSIYHKTRRTDIKHTIYYDQSVGVDEIEQLIFQEITNCFQNIIQNVSLEIGDVYFLPASRSGIYNGMSAFSSIVLELSKNRATLTKKIEFPGISEPTADYFIKLSNIRGREVARFKPYYQTIEDNILNGSVGINKNKNVIIYKSKDNGQQYEMTEVSSMVSEISPIVAFFKYIIADYPTRVAKRKVIVFIEEPEAHLHPENQVKLAEVFSALIQTGIKLVMSSHSNYIFNKFNNLVLGKKLKPDEYEPIILKKSGEGSISEYLKIDELGAIDENFTNVSQELMDERERIIDTYEFD